MIRQASLRLGASLRMEPASTRPRPGHRPGFAPTRATRTPRTRDPGSVCIRVRPRAPILTGPRASLPSGPAAPGALLPRKARASPGCREQSPSSPESPFFSFQPPPGGVRPGAFLLTAPHCAPQRVRRRRSGDRATATEESPSRGPSLPLRVFSPGAQAHAPQGPPSRTDGLGARELARGPRSR